MKQCKLCKSTYDDRVDFCFRDGSPLARVEGAPAGSSAPADAGVEASPVTEEMDAPVPVAMLRGVPGRASSTSPRLPSPLPPEVDMPGVGADLPSAEESGPSSIPTPAFTPPSWLAQSADHDEEATLAGLSAAVFASVAPPTPQAQAVSAPAAVTLPPVAAPVTAPWLAPSPTALPSAPAASAPEMLQDEEDLAPPVPIAAPLPSPMGEPEPAKGEAEPVKAEPVKAEPDPVKPAPEAAKPVPAPVVVPAAPVVAPTDDFDFPSGGPVEDEAPAAPPPSKSKAPMVIIALMSVGVLAAAGVAILKGGSDGDKAGGEPAPVTAPVTAPTTVPEPSPEAAPAATGPAATAAAKTTAAAATAPKTAANAAKTTGPGSTGSASSDNPWAAAAAATARLSVASTPAGARVYVDEKQVGQTPTSTDLAYGLYIVRLELDGYQATSQTVRLKEGGSSLNLKLDAVKASGQVNIFGPVGAEVFVDDRRVGAIPAISRLEEGAHTFKVVNSDGTSFTQSLEIRFSESGKPPAVHLSPP